MNGHINIFLDEKIFTIEEQYNNQNKNMYAQMFLEVSSEGAGRPSHFLRRGMLFHQGMKPLHFCKEGVKLVPKCIKGVVKPLNTNLFNGQEWVFQQVSANAHKTKTKQEWLRRNLLAFIRPRNGPQGFLTSSS